MAKIPINSYQGSSAYIATIPIEDGNILYNSTTKEILVDENGSRIRYGGAIVVDTALSTTSTNPVQNKVITTNINTINANLSALFDIIRPIGSLYPTIDSTFDPNNATGWHGTWERITDCVIYAAGASDTIGSIVGSNTHTLTEAELANHRHTTPQLTATGANHSHNVGVNNSNSQLLGISDTAVGTQKWAVVKNGGYSGVGPQISANNSGNLSMTVPASNTGYTGSGTAIDMRPRRINSVVWRRTA